MLAPPSLFTDCQISTLAFSSAAVVSRKPRRSGTVSRTTLSSCRNKDSAPLGSLGGLTQRRFPADVCGVSDESRLASTDTVLRKRASTQISLRLRADKHQILADREAQF